MENNNFGLTNNDCIKASQLEMQITSDLIDSSIDSLISNFLSSLLYDYTKTRIVENPVVLDRLKKVFRDELDRIIKVSVL